MSFIQMVSPILNALLMIDILIQNFAIRRLRKDPTLVTPWKRREAMILEVARKEKLAVSNAPDLRTYLIRKIQTAFAYITLFASAFLMVIFTVMSRVNIDFQPFWVYNVCAP